MINAQGELEVTKHALVLALKERRGAAGVVRCAGGIAIKCESEANVTCGRCQLGGFAWPVGRVCQL